jgi:DNA-binding GntR family transcriptional regulator
VVNRGSVIPPWQQLAGLLRARIEDGTYPPGGRIPSVVALSQEYDVAAGTVRKAIAQLQRESLVVSRVGWGTFVAEPE